ncbi:MAG: hypothetical protein ACREUY_06170, partial [Burkholderiales bacterium]
MSKTLGEMRFHLSKTPAGAGIDATILTNYINSRLREILNRNDWLRLIVTGTIQSVAAYDAGTLAVLEGAASLTGSGTTWTSAMTGRKMRISSRNEYYSFTYVSATSATLERVYECDDDSA